MQIAPLEAGRQVLAQFARNRHEPRLCRVLVLPMAPAPDAPVEVRLVERCAAHGGEDEFLRRVASELESASSPLHERGPDGGEQRHGAAACLGLRPLDLPARVGALDADQTPLSVDVAPTKRAQLAKTEPSAERDVEEVDVERSRPFPRGSAGPSSASAERMASACPGGIRAREVLGRREVGAGGWVCDEQPLARAKAPWSGCIPVSGAQLEHRGGCRHI